MVFSFGNLSLYALIASCVTRPLTSSGTSSKLSGSVRTKYPFSDTCFLCTVSDMLNSQLALSISVKFASPTLIGASTVPTYCILTFKDGVLFAAVSCSLLFSSSNSRTLWFNTTISFRLASTSIRSPRTQPGRFFRSICLWSASVTFNPSSSTLVNQSASRLPVISFTSAWSFAISVGAVSILSAVTAESFFINAKTGIPLLTAYLNSFSV